MKKFSLQEKREILPACDILRSSMVIFSAKEAIGNRDNNIGNIAKVARKGSIIDSLVQAEDLETLFKNKDWLNLLTTAENVNILLGDKLSKFLATICKYFPNETKEYLTPR